jgi:hypothetical protein
LFWPHNGEISGFGEGPLVSLRQERFCPVWESVSLN